MMRSTVAILDCSTLLYLIPMQGPFAQDMAETRRWIDLGTPMGLWENGIQPIQLNLANEIMMAHEMNEDGTTFGQALMDTRFMKTQMVTITT